MAQSKKCPFCKSSYIVTEHNKTQSRHRVSSENSESKMLMLITTIEVCANPECRQYTIDADLMMESGRTEVGTTSFKHRIGHWALRPLSVCENFPDYIPRPIRQDYEEACSILELSPKSSATLARRCLQGMIRDFWGVRARNLFEEIRAIEDRVDPSTWRAIDAVRNVGNIGAHMEKDINVVVEVEPSEAQSLVKLIEVLIKEWYVHRYEREQQMQEVVQLADLKLGQKKAGQE